MAWESHVGVEREHQERFSLGALSSVLGSHLRVNGQILNSSFLPGERWANGHTGSERPSLPAAWIPGQSRRQARLLGGPVRVGGAGPQTHTAPYPDTAGQDTGMSDSERPPHSGVWLPDSEWAVRSSDQTSEFPENKMFRRSLTSRTEALLLAGPTAFMASK